MYSRLYMENAAPPRERRLAALAYALGNRDAVAQPLHPLPLVVGADNALVARWGWPGFDRPLLHCRSETAATTRTWRKAWRDHRGVVPVAGWQEGDRRVDAPGALLAALWMASGDELRVAVLTREPPAGSRMPHHPIPLHEAGALAWLAGGEPDGTIGDLREYGQQTLFDPEPATEQHLRLARRTDATG